MKKINLNEEDKNRLIQMAWQDRTTFEGIKKEFGLTENQVKNLMRKLISKNGFKRWRKRVQDRITKHEKKVDFKPIRFKGPW
ncbi:TIGR03643 family protein [Arcobacter arenosus]|uniref:TIGR03643 family protein n=1 Tax=Arcobacter arenosus TaxID=2576037 RepID=A0A5R8Y089_9BACT|nr:TIGR03643 family protein [Arcobacter arenosus]TLP37493.1 TIGR03643 family protein [Arcobacter arenosus]